MPKANLFSESDLLEALQLVGRIGAPRQDLLRRKTTLLEGLARLVDADAWIWALQHLAAERPDPGYFAVIDGGWAHEGQKLTWLRSAFSPEMGRLLRPLAPRLHEHCTVTRSDLLDDEQWYASDFYRKFRAPVGLDDLLLSFYPVEPEVQSTIRLHRFEGREVFGPRERQIVHVVTGVLDWLHQIGVPDDGMPSIAELSRREREVLLLLLSGDSKKQIAYKLRLSQHTVNDYTKELHRHFAANSRDELLARFISPQLREALARLASDELAGRGSWGLASL